MKTANNGIRRENSGNPARRSRRTSDDDAGADDYG